MSSDQIPALRGRKRHQMPGVCPGQGGNVEASIWLIHYAFCLLNSMFRFIPPLLALADVHICWLFCVVYTFVNWLLEPFFHNDKLNCYCSLPFFYVNHFQRAVEHKQWCDYRWTFWSCALCSRLQSVLMYHISLSAPLNPHVLQARVGKGCELYIWPDLTSSAHYVMRLFVC